MQTGDDCLLCATVSNMEISLRMRAILSGQKLKGDEPKIDMRDLHKKYEHQLKNPKINKERKWDEGTLTVLAVIAKVHGVVTEEEEPETCKLPEHVRVKNNFYDIVRVLADGYPLTAGFIHGKNFWKLKPGQIYKAPREEKLTAEKSRRGHSVLLIGAGRRGNTNYFHFINSWGENFCLEDGGRYGFGMIRASDIRFPPVKFLRYEEDIKYHNMLASTDLTYSNGAESKEGLSGECPKPEYGSFDMAVKTPLHDLPQDYQSGSLGCLIYELFSGGKLTRTEDLRNIASIPKSLLPDYQKLLSSTPSRRMNPSKLIDNSEFFQNKLVETIQFMEVLNLKDSVEKDSFFRKLPNIAEQLPREIVLKKLLPVLASALEFGSAAAPALTVLLKMGSWLPADQFSTKVLPTIVKLFASNDRAIRVSLLQHIDQFGESLAAQTVDEQVFPHVATGFSDTSSLLRELTLKSMLVLAPKLSQRTISGSLLKYLSKLQVDEEPAIRTNTTILLGNISNYMNDGTRKRVLINAFTVRALRDTFPPARAAGIMALSVTSSFYEMTEIATRILPNIVVLTFDPDSDVRTKAFQATDQFLQIAKQHHEKLNTGDNRAAESTGAQLKPGNAGLIGWAMSSITQKGKPSDHGPVSTANASNSQVSASPSVTSDTRPAPVAYAPSTSNSLDQTAPALASSSVDGWGELENDNQEENGSDQEGWDDVDPFEEKSPPSLLSNIQAAQKRPVVQPKQPIPSSSRSNPAMAPKAEDDALWGPTAVPAPKSASKSADIKPSVSHNDDDDLWGSIAAPPPKSSGRPSKPAAANNDDLWGAIAAPPPATKARPLASSGRGRGSKPAQPKLGAQRIGRTSSTGM